jgi:acyl carrier protein
MEEQIKTIISKVLGIPNCLIDSNTEIGEPDEWDSLRNVQIFAKLEDAFSVVITQEMLADLENVGDIIDLIGNLKSE